VRTGRRRAIAALSLLAAMPATHARARGDAGRHPQPRWYDAAADMKGLAESSGDQPYGAVLVLGETIVGEGPSRVVRNNDSNAHAEREAIRDARRRLGRDDLTGSVLYSTSRPCGLCEAAAAEAGVSRMYFGSSLVDAGVPGRKAR
jgi:tRNA(adenine34) deaminase